jgi:succinate-semialdehyde dehydrogenase/glutarate-semialdehyde dehydrogenase
MTGADMPDLKTRALIGGEWVDTPRHFTIINPSSGEEVAQVADCGEAEARAAVEHAVEAFRSWRETTAYERSALMKKWHALILAEEQALARTIALEMGKPVTEALGEVRYAASFIEWYAEEAKRVYGETVPSQFAHKRLFATKHPVGPVYAVTPWNFPAAMPARKVGPALAAGCTIILKPAEQSPLTALRLAQLWLDAGGPPGVLQVLPCLDPVPVSTVPMEDRRIRKITFTGSTDVGRRLTRQAAATLKRVSMELGGHAPYIIFDDADVDQAVRDVAACKFRKSGQTCIAANRIYVQRTIVEQFSAQLAEAAAAMKVGDALDPATQIGPLVDQQGLDKVHDHVADAIGRGAQALTGGRGAGGLFYAPTVLIDIKPDMRLMREETFGPVAPILTFDTEEEVIEAANNTRYGLAAYLWTRDLSRAVRVSERLDYGIVGINDPVPSTAQAPFGGIKQSGFGREGGHWGIDEYLYVKFTSIGVQH